MAVETNMINMEYRDFDAIFCTLIIPQMPKMANAVKNKVTIANNIEIPFLSIILNFNILKYNDKMWYIVYPGC